MRSCLAIRFFARYSAPSSFEACLCAISLLSLLCLVPLGCDDSSGVTPEDATQVDTVADTSTADAEELVPEDVSDCPTLLCLGVCCGDGQLCEQGVCVDPPCTGIVCGEACCTPGGELCEAGHCVSSCTDGSVGCGGSCCGAGQGCDLGVAQCAELCPDGKAACGGQCCDAGVACLGGACEVTCETGESLCGSTGSQKCCPVGEVCEAGACLMDCGGTARCGSQFAPVCCAAAEVCEAGTCKIDCAGVRCGANETLCCDSGAGELCLFESCVQGQGPCVDNFDCALDAFCETSTHQCILTEDDPNQCIFVPPVGEFAPEVQWHWSGSTSFPTYNQVMMTPVVINLTDDNNDGKIDSDDIPDVVFGTFTGGSYDSAGVIRVVSGDDGRELAATNARNFSVASDLGAADVDYDGRPEIVVSTSRGIANAELYALNLLPDGLGGYTLEVVQTVALAGSYTANYMATAAAFADLEGNGSVEVVTQFGITNTTVGGWTQRCEASAVWYHAAVADLNEDGTQEIIAAGGIWGPDCSALVMGGGSRAAIADLVSDTGANDLVPEIIWVRPGISDGTTTANGTVELWNVEYDAVTEVWTTALLWATSIPMNQARVMSLYGWTCDGVITHKSCNSGGGTPTIADFDGDGHPEIGLAARWYYIVLETDGTILWADANTRDFSSAVTGSSVFDFEGDGAAEVVYNDELYLRIYKGDGSGVDGDGDGFSDPVVLFEEPNPSGTLYEMPLIVDVDNDGNAEIVMIANNYAFAGVTGIRVFRDPLDNWVRTRRVWNQHTYHVTNIDEDGFVPFPEQPNWRKAGLNNYRQNVQPGGLFNAPNLGIDAIAKNDDGCPATLNIEVTVRNSGSLGIQAGLWVGVYAVNLPAPDERALLGRVQTTQAIPPGQTSTLELPWDFSATLLPSGTPTNLVAPLDVEAIADDPPAAPGANGDHNECDETDNTSATTNVLGCSIN
ncbi:MAG: hypothetical protein AUK47_03700 [Deltaproteobacteria bacterium CG2_30_63_29]|nr:MAG: hypothetical protein AUK47_03700 [Deltaproteobacteria bacterium CG2_30_63_29]